MDRKQIIATVAGAALVGASLFGAVAAAQGGGDVAVSAEPAATSGAAPVAVLVGEGVAPMERVPAANDLVTDYVVDASEQDEYQEDEAEDGYSEYEEHDYEEDEDEEHDEEHEEDDYGEEDDDEEYEEYEYGEEDEEDEYGEEDDD